MAESFSVECCVRGYHVYKDIWLAAVGETRQCVREPTNSKDRYAVAVIKDDTTIGHLPRTVSKICSLFLRRGGSITCTVSGGRRYSSDLPQGGLEIPCVLLLKGLTKDITTVKRFLKPSS